MDSPGTSANSGSLLYGFGRLMVIQVREALALLSLMLSCPVAACPGARPCRTTGTLRY